MSRTASHFGHQVSSAASEAVFHCEDKHASSLRNFCPCLFNKNIERPFLDLQFGQINEAREIITHSWFLGQGRQLLSVMSLPRRRKKYRGRSTRLLIPRCTLSSHPEPLGLDDLRTDPRCLLHLLCSFNLRSGCGPVKFGHEDGCMRGCPKQNFWYIILKSFLGHSSHITLGKLFSLCWGSGTHISSACVASSFIFHVGPRLWPDEVWT